MKPRTGHARSTGSLHERNSVQHYAREIRPFLPAEAFRPVPTRLLWLPIHLAVIVGAAAYTIVGMPPWYSSLAVALLAGHSWGCLGFLAHETLHHSVIKNRFTERLIGYFGFTIYCLSPALWVRWHNQAHHGNTGVPVADPDGYGPLVFWRQSKFVRELEKLAPGSGYKRSAAYLFTWFSLHSFLVLVFHSQHNNYYTRMSRRTVYAESAAMLAFWMLIFALFGPYNFMFLYVVPVLVANSIIMSYIATNHFLNSLTKTNDPFVNSLSVRSPQWIERLHLNFGYHVEHHIFPTMNPKFAPLVRDVAIRLHGDRLLSMPHTRALKLLYTRPKIHKGYDMVIDPRTRETFETLSPGDLTMQPVSQR